MVVGSLLLHALLLALILWLPPDKPTSGSEGTSIEVVMDGSPGTPNDRSNDTARTAAGSETPVPGQETTSQPPPAPDPAPAPPAPPPPAPTAPTPPAPPPPAPEAPPVPETPPAPQPPPEAPPAPTPPPPNAVPRVSLPSPDATADLPPPQTRPPLDITPLPPLTFTPPPAPPRPRQLAQPQTRSAPRSASGFPTPQNWSLSGGLVSPSRQGSGGQSLSMMAGPSVAGPSVPGPRISGADLGADWINLYTAWVRSHLYYPEQAALNGEDGTAEVVLEINRSGKVLSVQLVTRSGSQWLDLASTAMFRNARVPPFPANVTGDTATVDQTIHYILRRR